MVGVFYSKLGCYCAWCPHPTCESLGCTQVSRSILFRAYSESLTSVTQAACLKSKGPEQKEGIKGTRRGRSWSAESQKKKKNSQPHMRAPVCTKQNLFFCVFSCSFPPFSHRVLRTSLPLRGPERSAVGHKRTRQNQFPVPLVQG